MPKAHKKKNPCSIKEQGEVSMNKIKKTFAYAFAVTSGY